MKYLYVTLFLGFLVLLSGCITTNEKMNKELFLEVDAIHYKSLNTDSIIINNRYKINDIINLIRLSTRKPSVFISKEVLIFKKTNQDSIVINRNNEFLDINGRTYIMDKSASRRLNDLLLDN